MLITPMGKKLLGFVLVIVGAVLTTLVLSSGGEYYRLIATVVTALVGPVLIWMGHSSPD